MSKPAQLNSLSDNLNRVAKGTKVAAPWVPSGTMTPEERRGQLKRAEALGLMGGGELRERLGLTYPAFLSAINSGRLPKPHRESGGEKFFKRDDVELLLKQLGK